MRKIALMLITFLVVSAVNLLPFSGTDVAKLHPVEVLAVSRESGYLAIHTDTGLVGRGEDLRTAFQRLERISTGEVFFDTANYLLISQDCLDAVEGLSCYLRPACQVYLYNDKELLEDVAKYLENHKSHITLLDYRKGDRKLPVLTIHGEEYYLNDQ